MGVKNACNDNDFDVFILVLGLKAGAELLVVDAYVVESLWWWHVRESFS